MSFIRTISPKEATGRVKEFYKEFENHPPSIVRIFSIRPDLMEAFNAASNAHFLSPTPLSPKLRQLIAVIVSKANSCSFCFDSHSVFLQALGFSPLKYRKLIGETENHKLDALSRVLSEFSRKTTINLTEVGSDDIRKVRNTLGDGGFVEAVFTVACFNWINRVANSLGVTTDLIFKSAKAAFRVGLGQLHPVTRILKNLLLTPRTDLPSPDPKEILCQIESLYIDRLGFEEIPPFYHQLMLRPIQMGAWAIMASNFLGDGMLPLESKVLIANVVARTDGYDWLFEQTTKWLEEKGRHDTSESSPTTDGLFQPNSKLQRILQLAGDIALHSYKITEQRIEELRSEGMRDEEVLELVGATAFFNAESRLYRCLVQ